ncbi:MAG TPA: TIGR03619 family F420-dependent LLM class oxidoreductase, partial [Trebonia sp.]|nr:TIGR03619 family F420-dependent LLM class oxidoreductase [Trebonia sp.]
MRIGFGAPVAGAWAGPDSLARFAEQAETLGYQSLWTFQRLLVPEPAPGHAPAEPQYRSVLDPMIALAYAAARTTRIRLGVAVLNMPYLAPTYLAKQAATLDLLCGGRLDLGLGNGWSGPEFTATGADPAQRGARAEEYVTVLRAHWAPGPASFHGRFYSVPPSRMDPKPVQDHPGPPILLGGAAPAALRRAGRLADGWLARSATDLTTVGASVAIVREAAEQAGRDPDTLRIIVRGVTRYDPGGHGTPGPDGRRLPLSGNAEQIRSDREQLAGQGVTEVYHDLNWDPRIGSPDAERDRALQRAEQI